MPRKQYAGGAVATKLNGSINNTTTTVVVLDASTYPSGATPFVIAVDRGTASEEKMLCTRVAASNTLTATRGFDGTTGVAHNDAAVVEHVLDAATVDEANLLANTMTANGDLLTRSGGAPAALPVGSTNQVLSVVSGAPSWQTVTPGMRNVIMNGDFRINQRGFSSSTVNGVYGFDRFIGGNFDGTVTYSAQAFTPGSPAAASYESANFARLAVAGQSSTGAYAIFSQHIEDVRTLPGAQVTTSFWAKAASGTPQVAVEMIQNFGSGGSGQVFTLFGKVTLSTSWQRFTLTGTVPSIAGKTIGAGSSLQWLAFVSAGSSFNARTGSLGIQNNTFDFWGVQVERGAAATAFEERPLAVELAMCERYFQRYGGQAQYENFAHGFLYNGTQGLAFLPLRTAMRVRPVIAYGLSPTEAIYITGGSVAGVQIATANINTLSSGPSLITVDVTLLSAGAVGPIFARSGNSLNAYWDFSAEF
jgi:hypothetical protein